MIVTRSGCCAAVHWSSASVRARRGVAGGFGLRAVAKAASGGRRAAARTGGATLPSSATAMPTASSIAAGPSTRVSMRADVESSTVSPASGLSKRIRIGVGTPSIASIAWVVASRVI